MINLTVIRFSGGLANPWLIVSVGVADIFSFPGKSAGKFGEVLQTRVVLFDWIAQAGYFVYKENKKNMDTN